MAGPPGRDHGVVGNERLAAWAGAVREFLGGSYGRGRSKQPRVAHIPNVTDMTVRRDLALLEQRGLIKRVYRGAILATDAAPEVQLFRGLLERYTDGELDRVGEFLLATCGLLEAARTSATFRG
jgi:DeoR-like helix-turn-helix domain